MAKYAEPFEDTQASFQEAIVAAGLSNNVNITILVDNKAKKIFKIRKADDVLKHRTGDDIIIFLNEEIYEKLPNDLQKLMITEAIAYISYNLEDDKVEIVKPDFEAHSEVLNSKTYPVVQTLRESVKSLYDAKKQAEDERKATTEKGKKKHAHARA